MSRYRCPGCDYVYDEAQGDEHEGYPPGTPFDQLPDDFTCPDCSVREKSDFEPLPD
ncbi:rubredoxin [Parahaliea maris]|uniref:Rubredoxin n=1 Tax=Parahaliea maris TaxID=2716870 RepID=A0A5C9A3L4_9GAMM|nr:rubredoxin [Parahaliea maris]TXS95306.1 rubredoxin [Parahaliea maris]